MKQHCAFIALLITLLFISSALSAQKQKPKNESWYDDKPIHFGFSLGFNTMDFKITPSQEAYQKYNLFPEVSILNPGINIQIISNYHISNHADIRFLPGVSFGQRVIRYYNNSKLEGEPQKLESSFLEFPLLLKYKGDRLNNIRPYVITGLNFRYDLAGKKEYDDQKPIYIRIKRPDLYYEFGAGMDFYLTYFKLSIELKMSNGLGNVLVKEAPPSNPKYYETIDKLKSQIWILAFHFE